MLPLRRGLGAAARPGRARDFRPAALRDADILDLSRRVDVNVDDNLDPNALIPVTVEITLRDGRSETEQIEVMYGHPARPMTRTAQIEKYHRYCAAAAKPIAAEAAERVIAAVARLESLPDVTALVDESRSRSRHPSATRLSVWPPARWEDTSELTYDPSSIGKRRESKSGAFGRGYGGNTRIRS